MAATRSKERAWHLRWRRFQSIRKSYLLTTPLTEDCVNHVLDFLSRPDLNVETPRLGDREDKKRTLQISASTCILMAAKFYDRRLPPL